MKIGIHSPLQKFKNSIYARVNSFVQLPVVGFDISDESAKYLKLRSRSRVAVEAYGEFGIPAGLIERGEIKKEDELSRIFASWLAREKGRLRSRFVAVSLPEEKSYLRVVQIPRMEKDKVANAIRWELEANIPLPLDELFYDYEIIRPFSGTPDHFDVVVVAFPRTIVESYARTLGRAGFLLVALELESQAIVRSVVPSFNHEASTVIIDMGSTRTSIIVFSGNAIIFTTTIELGGRTIEGNIMRTFGVSEKEAVDIKKNIGLDRKKYDGRVFLALAPSLSVLDKKIREAVQYYEGYAQHRHGAYPTIGAIVLSGGDANLLGLDTHFASSLKIPVYRANPLSSLRDSAAVSVPPIPRNQSLAFATAMGLALRQLR